MKKLSLLIAVLVLLSSFVMPVSFAAQADFEIKDGVLLRYTGSAADVTLPSAVTAIGDCAFKGDTSLRSVSIPDSVYAVGAQAFDGCTALTAVTGGANVSEVGDLAFRGTPYLERSTVKYLILGHVLLWYNGTSESVTIPSSCTAVAPYAFMKCDYLKSFTAIDGLLSIGTGAFYKCSNLKEVNLPDTVSEIGAYAFDGTPYPDTLGEFATVGDGVLIRYQGTDTDIRVPDGVRRIAAHAFSGSSLSRVTLPDSVYAIDAYAFADCTGLSSVGLNDGLTTIGNGAFRGCKSLKLLKTPSTLQYIGQKAYSGSSLDTASLRGNSLTVSYNAFKGCTALRSVLLSENTQAVLDNAFDGCTALEGISVPVAAIRFSSKALNNCPKVTVCCDEKVAGSPSMAGYRVCTLIGDADTDNEISVVDATVVQYYIAGLMALDGTQVASADFNFDGSIDVEDAFWIQMKVAALV